MKCALTIALTVWLGGCAAPTAAPNTLRFENAWVRYVETASGQNVKGIGGVTGVTLDPGYVRFETSQGTYVIPRERLVEIDPVPSRP